MIKSGMDVILLSYMKKIFKTKIFQNLTSLTSAKKLISPKLERNFFMRFR